MRNRTTFCQDSPNGSLTRRVRRPILMGSRRGGRHGGMDKDLASREEIQARLRRVEGQIRGIQRMVAEERGCEAIITQLMAARAALDRASRLILSHHLERCLAEQVDQPDHARLERLLEFLIKLPPASVDTSKE
jgi:DNA-binding FrmR family transcriptional regulator